MQPFLKCVCEHLNSGRKTAAERKSCQITDSNNEITSKKISA